MTNVFGSAVYYNEDHDRTDRDWQSSSFGSNYPKLLAIKEKYDPSRLLNARMYVGSEGGF